MSKISEFGEVERNVDADDGNSWLCCVCNIPIFSTPYYRRAHGRVLHDRCANLPKELKDCDVHPEHRLILRDNDPKSPSEECRNCYYEFSFAAKYYDCADCYKKYDVFCALMTPIGVWHRSHDHRLMAINSGGWRLNYSGICDVCGTRHVDDTKHLMPLDGRLNVSYTCHICAFSIHPHCASLPNVIVQLQHDDSNYSKHHHPLVLNYRIKTQRPTVSIFEDNQQDRVSRYCAICKNLIKSVGDYSCIKCRDYYVHIMCAVSNPKSFEPLLFREAQLPGLLRLPIPDERTSVIRCITDSTTSTTVDNTSNSGDNHDDCELRQLHEHRLIFHDDDDDDYRHRVCNGCVQLIISPDPFYRCSECPDFFLHKYCAHLPRRLSVYIPRGLQGFELRPSPGRNHFMSMVNELSCCTNCPINGFTYCSDFYKFRMDVLCALMPDSITHDAHSKTHILSSSFADFFTSTNYICACCGDSVSGLYYRCGIRLNNFRLHSRCALLPNTVSYSYDQHPLKLITRTTTSKWCESGNASTDHDNSSQQQNVVLPCEICEKDIDDRWWYYSCNECDQSFHIDCIPCLDRLSKIKLGVKIRVKCHDCPLTLVRGLAFHGSHCGYCEQTFKNDNRRLGFGNYDRDGGFFKGDKSGLAFECSKCDFRIHFGCAEKVVEDPI